MSGRLTKSYTVKCDSPVCNTSRVFSPVFDKRDGVKKARAAGWSIHGTGTLSYCPLHNHGKGRKVSHD